MRSSLDARRAGTTPKNKPIPLETLTAKVIAVSGTVGLKGVSIFTLKPCNNYNNCATDVDTGAD